MPWKRMMFKNGKVWINKTQYFDEVPEVAWTFRIGGYQPAQKWLKDRTCILTTHRMGVLRIVDTVAVLSGGAVALHGPRDVVVEKLQTNKKGAENVSANAAT